MYQNRTLSKFLLTILLVVCTFIYPAKSYGQTFELVKNIGAGGVALSSMLTSTKVSSTEVAFFEYTNNLLTYNSLNKKFTRIPIPFFSGIGSGNYRNGYPEGMTYVDGKFVFLVHTNWLGINTYSLVTTTKEMSTLSVIPLATDIPLTSDIAAVNDYNVRYVSNQGLVQVNVFTGLRKVVATKLPVGITSYVRIDDADYVTTTTKVYKLKKLGQPQMVLESPKTILSVVISDSEISYINENLDFVTVKKGIPVTFQDSSRKGETYFSGGLSYYVPTKLYRLANGVFLGHDRQSVATFSSKYRFTNRYGAFGLCYPYQYSQPAKNAVSENGSTAVGRVGFVSVTDAFGNNQDVTIKTLYNLDAFPVALTFASEQFVLVAYVDSEPIWHSGVMLIDVNQGQVIRQIELNVGAITDIEYNNNVYLIADGNLLTLDLFLSAPPVRIPNIVGTFDLSEQGGYLYVQQPRSEGYIKLDQNNAVVNRGIQSSFLTMFDFWVGLPSWYFHVLPDESLLKEIYGYTGPDDGSSPFNPDGSIRWFPYNPVFCPQSMSTSLGNGKKSYFISGGDYLIEVYRYTPPQK
jgi:hypothetical protein